MPHKSDKPSRKPVREEDLEHELEPAVRDVTTSPISSASSYSSVSGLASSGGSSSSCATLSSEQLEMILSANSKALADSMAANNKTMEASMMSIISTLTPAVPVASSHSAPSSHVKIPKWTDEDTPFEFFTKLETALTHNGVDKATWGRLLPVYLAGKAQAAFAQVDQSSLADYDSVKAVLLEALGDTTACADRRWWTLARQPGEEPAQFYLRVRATGLRMLSDCTSRDAVVEQVILSRFLSLLPSDGYSSVVSKHPKNGLEAARFLQEFEETRTFSRRRQGWRQDHHSHSGRREPSSSSGGGSSSSQGSVSPGSSNSGSSAGIASCDGPSRNVVSDPGSHGAASGGNNFCENAPQQDVVYGGVQNPDGHCYQERRNRKPIVCHGCGEPGHIRPNCPNVIRRVRELGGVDLGKTVEALLDGRPVRALVDTGAGRTMVHKDFVPRACYTGRSIRLRDWQGRYSRHRTAEILIQVGEVKRLAVVAVDDSLDYPAALGSDLGVSMTRQLMTAFLAKLDEVGNVNDEVPMQVDNVNDEVPMHDEPVALEDIFDFSDSYFEPEVACDATDVPLEDIFGFPDSYFEPEVACVATVVPLEEAVESPEVDKVELPLPDLGCDVVEASVALVGSEEILVNMQQEEVKVEVVEASVAPVSSDNFVVPMQQVEVKVDLVEACVAPVDDGFEIFNFSDEFFVEDQADEVASGPVDSKPMELSDAFNFADSFFEEDPVFASVSEAMPEPAKVVVDVTLVKEDSMSSELCRQSSSILVDSDQRFLHCYSKTTGKFAPGCNAFTDSLLCLYLKLLLFVLFVLVFSMCMCKFLVLKFFGDFGPIAVLLLHRLDDPLCRMPEAPTVLWTSLTCLLVGCQKLPLLLRPWVNSKGGEMLWSPPSQQPSSTP